MAFQCTAALKLFGRTKQGNTYDIYSNVDDRLDYQYITYVGIQNKVIEHTPPLRLSQIHVVASKLADDRKLPHGDQLTGIGAMRVRE